MDFFDYDLSTFNETDVREAIVAPMLAHLGYKRGGQHNIRTEVSLTYPRNFLGRKKASDPPLRGKADYTLEVDGRIRWVVEVKAPGESLSADVIHQAYSYAIHPEVGAVYYCVTNGRELKVFQTNQGTHSNPSSSVPMLISATSCRLLRTCWGRPQYFEPTRNMSLI